MRDRVPIMYWLQQVATGAQSVQLSEMD